MRKAVFTVLTGNYEMLNPAPVFDGWDSILLTDCMPSDPKGWTPIVVKSAKNRLVLSRQLKINSHLFLTGYRLVCYIDANITLTIPPPEEVSYFRHTVRSSVLKECERVVELGKSCPVRTKKQLEKYVSDGFGDDIGLYQLGFFVREHNQKLNRLHEEWFKQVSRHTQRDQISFPYALWKTGMNLNGYAKPAFFISKHTKLMPHKKPPINVHHITPGRSDKNFGRAVNEIVEKLPDNDWVCLRDIDTIPAYHEHFFKQCEGIAAKGEADLIGCMTNRVGLKWQLHGGVISNNTDILYHRSIGMERAAMHNLKVEILDGDYIAGFFMLFPKSTWKTIGGFPEGKILIKGSFVDWWVCDMAHKKGLKIGLAKGLYVFHLYRGWKKDSRDIKHLL